jgi:hypothetical protein
MIMLQSRETCGSDDPQGFRIVDGREFRRPLGCTGDGGARDRAILRRQLNRGITKTLKRLLPEWKMMTAASVNSS